MTLLVVAVCWLAAPKLRDLELADLHDVGKK
jgi:hypothetical protein